MGHRRLLLLWIALSAAACPRIVTQGPPDAATEAPVIITGVEVEALRVPRDGGVHLAYGGDVLAVTGSGWDPAAATVQLGGVDLAMLRDRSTVTALRAVLPERVLEGTVKVLQGGRVRAESPALVAVLGVGHPDLPVQQGAVEPRMAIRAAGIANTWCAPSLADGGVPCSALPNATGTLAVAFSFGPDLLYRDPTYLAELTLFGPGERITERLEPAHTDYRSVAAAKPFLVPRPGGRFDTGLAVHQAWSADGGFGISVDTFPPQMDGGGLELHPVLLPGPRGGLLTLAVERVNQVEQRSLLLDNGRPVLRRDGTPMSIEGRLAAVGGVVQGYDFLADAYGEAEFVAASCGDVTPDGRLPVRLTRLFQPSGDVLTQEQGVPLDGWGCRVDGGPNPALDGGQQAQCDALQDCGEGCFFTSLCSLMPTCRPGLGDMNTCLRDSAGCRGRVLTASACLGTEGCGVRAAGCPGADGGPCPCNDAPCRVTRQCFLDAPCLAALGCYGDGEGLCILPPACAAAADRGPDAGPGPEGETCAAQVACMLDPACADRAECPAGGCTATAACARSLCPTEPCGNGQECGRPSDDAPGELSPLVPGSLLVHPGRALSPFQAPPEPVCTFETFRGRLLPFGLDGYYVSSAATLSADGTHHLVARPAGGTERILLVMDLETLGFSVVSASAAYADLLAVAGAPLLFGIPAEGGQVHVLDERAQFRFALNVLGPATHAFPRPRSDGRVLVLHPGFVLELDGNGGVERHAFHGAPLAAPQLPEQPGAAPSALWAVRPLEVGPPELVQVSLADDTFGEVSAAGTLPADSLPEGRALGDAFLGAVATGDTVFLNVSTGATAECDQDAQVVAVRPSATGTGDVTWSPVAGTCGGAITAFNPVDRTGLVVVPVEGGYQTDIVGETGGTWHTLDRRIPQIAFGAAPRPAGGFVGLFAADVGGAARLELGLVAPATADAGPPYQRLMDAETSDAVMVVSPDGQRLYVGGLDRVLEVELVERCRDADAGAGCAPWELRAEPRRAIAIDGRAHHLAVDPEGTRVVYVDLERQSVGVLE
ncbi:MAG: hypothetical protein HY904_19590 [Deltaproteobacteria bacterium]|nr:hypothetical protein [Deltaproteobacteria bacterium]